MNLKHIKIILKKELTDFLRDKRTLFSSIFLPAIILIVLFYFLGNSSDNFENDMKENIKISLTKDSQTKESEDFLKEQFKDAKNIKVKNFDDPNQALKDEKVNILIEIENDFTQKLDSTKPFKVKLLYDESKLKSSGSLNLVISILENSKKQIASERLVELEQNPDILDPFVIDQKDMSKENKSGSSVLTMIIPMLLTILLAQSGIAAATDLVAGEKERNTFESLLTTKASRLSILIGKYFTIIILSFLTVTSSLVAYVISFKMNPGMLGSTESISLDPIAILLTILIMIALGCTFSGISITLSTYAKSFKEAQTYLGFLIIVSMIPAYATMFMQVSSIKVYMYFVPILNTIVSIKMALSSNINYLYLFFALISTLVYVVLTLTIAVKMFNKEKVLFRN
ncbi:MAG: ABC transporter permease [Clostridiales bacterium]